MNKQDLEITKEILGAIEYLSGTSCDIPRLFADILYSEAEKRGADAGLLSIIGSWDDTLENEEILELLRDYQNPPF